MYRTQKNETFLGNKSLELQANGRFEWRGPWGSLIVSPWFTAKQVTPHEVESLGRITLFLSDRAQSRGSSRTMLRKRSPGVLGVPRSWRCCEVRVFFHKIISAHVQEGGQNWAVKQRHRAENVPSSKCDGWADPTSSVGPVVASPGSAVWPQLCLRLQTPQSLCDTWGYRCHQAFPALSSPESWTQMLVLRIV